MRYIGQKHGVGEDIFFLFFFFFFKFVFGRRESKRWKIQFIRVDLAEFQCFELLILLRRTYAK